MTTELHEPADGADERMSPAMRRSLALALVIEVVVWIALWIFGRAFRLEV